MRKATTPRGAPAFAALTAKDIRLQPPDSEAELALCMQPDDAMGPLLIRPSERRVYLQGQRVVLGARDFDLVLALIERRDRVVSK